MNDSRPYFSIIIPAFNSSDTISNTLISIHLQNESDYEVIIIDDNSSDLDALKSIVQDFRNKGMIIKLYASSVKLNGSGARNKGVELSSGRYIALMDADDEWNLKKLAKVKSIIQENNDKDCIYYSRVLITSEKDDSFKKIMPLRGYDPTKETIASYIFGCQGFIQTSSIVLKKEIYERIKFDSAFIRHQDYDFCIRADSKGVEFVYIDDVLSIYKMSSISSKSKGESIGYSLNWLSKMASYINKYDVHCFKAFKLSKKYPVHLSFWVFIYNFMYCKNSVKLDFLSSVITKANTKLFNQQSVN